MVVCTFFCRLVGQLGIRSPGGGLAKHSDPTPPSAPSASLNVIPGEQLVRNAHKKAKSMTEVEMTASMKLKLEHLTPSRNINNHLSPLSIAMETATSAMETDISSSLPVQSINNMEKLVKQEPPSGEQLDAVVEFCSEALGRGVLSLLDLRNRLLLKQTTLASESPSHVLSQQSVSDKLLEEGLSRCRAMEVGQACGKRLFALTHGDPVSPAHP